MHRKFSQDEKLAIAREGMLDPCFFMRTFLPEWFPLPMPWVHRGILAVLSKQTDWLLKFGPEQWPGGEGVWDERSLDKILRHFVWYPEPDDPTCPPVPIFAPERDSKGNIHAVHMQTSNRMLFIMPRGVSKTTLINGSNLRDIVNHELEFMVYLSETATHAKQQLENIKRELETNEPLRDVYGDKKPARNDSERWAQDFFETTDNIAVAARGRGGQVRGLNHLGVRPQRIIFDDVEDKESVQTQEQRDKALHWLTDDVIPALPRIGTGGRREIIGLGTIIHPEALIVKLMRDPEWVVARFGAIDPDGDMLWEHYMSRQAYDRARRSAMRLGNLAGFTMETDSTTKLPLEQAKFPPPYTYMPMQRGDFPGVALAVDPAISENKNSADYCAFAVVGMSERGKIHVLDFHAEIGMSPRQQVDKYFELYLKWTPTKAGVEGIAYQMALVHLLREEMFRKAKQFGSRVYHEIEPIKHGKTGKIPRVEGVLAPRFAAGYITFQRRFQILEEQLMEWTSTSAGKKDGPDAVAMAVTLLDPYAAFALEDDEDGTDKLAKDQYEPLDVALPGWRTAP